MGVFSVSDDVALLRRAGLVLPVMPAPIGNFVPVAEAGGMLYLSGAAPLGPDGAPLTGKTGSVVSVSEARRRAGLTALTLLAAVALEPGRLSRVARVVRVFGMVNAPAGFTGAGEVLDGCSETLGRIWPGGHARSDVVLPALPNDITVEIEAVFELRA